MKTWLQSAATAAKITGILCFGTAGIVALSQVAAWLAMTVGIVPTIMLLTFAVFVIVTVFVRIGSRVRAEARAEMDAHRAEYDARRAKIDANIQRARAMAHQASSWRPDVPIH